MTCQIYASNSTNSSNSNMSLNSEENKVESKKTCKRESWSKQQATVLVNSWKHLYKEIETFKQPTAWLKVKELVDKHSQPKSVIQIKNKLRNLKLLQTIQRQQQKTGTSPSCSTFYHDFDEVVGTWDVVNLQYVTQVDAKDTVPDCLKHSHGGPMLHTPAM